MVYFSVHSFLLHSWRCTIARGHLSCCSDVNLAVSSSGQDLTTLTLRSLCSVACCHQSYHTKTETYVLQLPSEEEDLNTCISLLLSKHYISNSTGNQSSLCQKFTPPPDEAFEFVASNGIC